MNKIRVLEIVEATTGGVRRHVTDLVCHLDPERFAVSVICATLRDRGFEADIQRMREGGAAVTVVQMVRPISPWRDLSAWLRIFGLIRHGRYDVVHTHSSKAGFLGRSAAAAAGVRAVIHTPHTFAFEMGVGRLRRAFYRSLERVAARWTDRLICVCAAEASIARRAGLDRTGRCVIIENGVSDSAFQATLDRAPARALLGLPPDGPVVGMVGRFEAQKGHLDLVRAAPAVLRRIPNVRFALVGDGSKLPAVRREIEALGLQAHFTPPGAVEQASALYPAFDVFALPSRWESLPYSLIEAMAAGKAIVATRVGGVPEAILDERSGLLAPPADPVALAVAIANLLEKPEWRLALGAAARDRAWSLYRLGPMMAKVEALYASTLDGTG